MPKAQEKPIPLEVGDSSVPHRIFLIRHGETDWNRDFRYQGISDIDLNETGLEQARLTGMRLAGTVPANVYSSPLIRARRTAEIIMKYNSGGVDVELCDHLREVSFGKWEGLNVSEVKKRYPAALAAWRSSPFSATPEDGESFGDVKERSRIAADLIKSNGNPGGVTFVIAHGGMLRALLAALMDVEDFKLMWMMRFDNCSISVLDMWRAHPSLLFLNDTHHIRLGKSEISRLSFPK
ncbi:MAG: histidine phosphatase family protein [Synergistaceae bacterium]|jgi:broad specificity phosphatase PhoE|nr:histidine phosphatase family protein [Synergistaceae bacterium]